MDLWAFATSPSPQGLGLAAEALWRSTPLEFEALSDRYLAHQKEHQVMWARQAALTYNLGRPEHGKQISDFMPGETQQQETPEQKAWGIMMAAKLSMPIKEEDVPEWAKKPSVN